MKNKTKGTIPGIKAIFSWCFVRNSYRMMIEMKTKKTASFFLAALLMLSVLPFGVFAVSTPVVPTSTASITIENALENDQLSAYKVVDIRYDAGNNTLSYAWNSAFTDYFSGKTLYNTTVYTVETFATFTDDSDALKDLLAKLPSYIKDRSIAPVQIQTVGADGKAIFADLAMGEYFIRPTLTTSVYQLMLQKVEPTVANVGGTETYVIDDVAFTAKKEKVNIAKTADKTSVTKNEKVTYTIAADIPTYSDNATDQSFSVYDLLPDGLTIDKDSITIKRDGTDITGQAGTQYTLDKTANTTAEPYHTFRFSVDTAQYAADWSASGGKQLVISYTATLNDDATTEVNVKEANLVTFDYSFYPYVESSHIQKTDQVDITTYAIKINKFVKGKSDTKLAGATFDLYRTATQEEKDAGTAVEIPYTTMKGIKLESNKVTDANGIAVFEKYEANSTNYDYYLVETAAPSGYNILDNAVKVNFTDAEVAATSGVYTVDVPNRSGIKLPITGGTGTAIFTVIGIGLMVVAVLLFVFARKKVKAK